MAHFLPHISFLTSPYFSPIFAKFLNILWISFLIQNMCILSISSHLHVEPATAPEEEAWTQISSQSKHRNTAGRRFRITLQKKVFDSKICLVDVNIVANNKVKDLIQIVKREVLDKRWNDSKFSYILSRSPLTPLLNRPETRKPLHLILAMPQNRFCYKYGHFLRRAAKEGSFFKHII